MRVLFVAFVVYSFVFHWYPYLYSWSAPDQPSAPLPIILSRDVFFIAIVLVALGLIALRGAVPRVRPQLVATVAVPYLLLAMLLLVLFVRLPVDDGVQHHLRNLVMYTMAMPVYWIAAATEPRGMTAQLAKLFLVAGVVLSLFGFWTLFFVDRSLLWGGLRVYSLLGNPNTFGTFLVLPLTLAYAMALQVSNRARTLRLMAAAMLCGAAIVVTLSFQAMACAIGALLLVPVLVKGSRGIGYVAVTLGAIAAVAYGVVVVYPAVPQALWFRLMDPTSTSYLGRIAQFELVREVMADPMNWVLGLATADGYQAYDSQFYNLAVNSGVVGLALYVVPIWWVLYVAIRHRAEIQATSDSWSYAMYVGGTAWLSVLVGISFVLTATGQRFPINFYLFLILGILLRMVSDVNADERATPRTRQARRAGIEPPIVVDGE